MRHIIGIKYFLLSMALMATVLSPFRCARWDASRWVKNTGDVAEIVMPCVTTAIILVKNDFLILPHWMMAGAMTALSVNFLKYTIPTKRPNGGKHSFPSGHTATAFVSACFLWFRYGYRYGMPMLVLAIFVGFSRIYSHSHYLRDVLAGALIGLVCAGFSGFTWRKLLHYCKKS
ncbi:MAG: phosphatase PAP2 family protein [Puniceicoccales bacterium]|jgi:membrane-associated phospholipid phosphatase|nr:phosphatase PAP2 family protein [Puniceicoccales bacterium]